MVAVSSWGRLSHDEHEVRALSDPAAVARQLCADGRGLAHGASRSYGDVALNPGGVLWQTAGLDHFIDFDPLSGRLVCEAGVLLRDIQRMAIPRGWIVPVTPGTQVVTVGGAIANDVHGKNHHGSGSFGDHVRWLKLVRTDGTVIECGPELAPDWFAATVGGAGLTGVITHAEIQLRRVAGPWLDTETIPYRSVDEFVALADASEHDWEYTVSWIDCLSEKGRGIFLRANPAAALDRAEPVKRAKTMPVTPPFSLINQLSLRVFNEAYFQMNKYRAGRAVVHYEPFFYPLDNLLEWNRIYGPKGFFQYQCVVPRQNGIEVISAMLAEIARSNDGSFLAVLKTFGNRSAPGMLSFAQPGLTLALDFPNHGQRTERLFERLDAIVASAHGRLYLAKDARMPRVLFEAGYARLSEFLAYRDPGISSALSRRLMGS
jgi:FAD/FMN-containing dehydrogenase